MKIWKNKKMLMSLSLAVGILLIVVTAFADSVSKSAYEQLKDSVKFTTFEMEKNISSSTVTMNAVLKDNGNIIFSTAKVTKQDNNGNKRENTELTEYAGGKVTRTYYYSDSSANINYDAYSDTYYVYEYTNDGSYYDYNSQTNIFEEEYAKDIEKIFDALVGNLKNYVTVTLNDDGSKEFSGSLSDAQIPSLINAIASFASKQFFNQSVNTDVMYAEHYEPGVEMSTDLLLPEMSGDVSIKSVSGTAQVNADGIIDSISVTGVLTGKDTNGNVHDLSAEILVSIKDIGSTLLARPDLTGKNVILNKADGEIRPTDTLAAKFIGAYKSDIIIETADSLEKIGERIIVISEISGANVKGSYTETYVEGYEDRYDDMSGFSFETVSTDPYSLRFEFTDKAGNLQFANMYFDPATYTIQFYIDNEMSKVNANYVRIFD